MIHNLKEYYAYSVKDKNLLIYSKSDFSQYTEVLDEFKSHRSIDINELSLHKLSAYIVTHSIDTILIDITPEATKIYEVLKDLDEKINILLYLRIACEEPHAELINRSEGIIAEPFSDNDLRYKFFTMLNYTSAIGAINSASSSMSKLPSVEKENLEDYLDTYEGQILFLSESLQSSVERLDSGELHKDLLYEIASQIDEVASIFANHYYTKKVSPIFTELSSYVKTIEYEKIAIENLEGFEYLSRIIEDINVYVVEYFVDRIFTDVYIFEDSLTNSVQFMKDRLSNTKDESSELEFF